MGRASKDKRDIFYRLAKEEGWRARSAFKLLQINETFNIFPDVQKAVDLCAAPGSWSQVLAQSLPKGSTIVAVDLQTMAPIPGVTLIKGDITRESTADEIVSKLGNSRADLVVCDGAPDLIGFHLMDQYFQSQLVLAALNIALAVLQPGGTFVAKYFRADEVGVQTTYLRFKIFFKDVVLTKPRSSRASSHECFILARDFNFPANFSPKTYNPFNRHENLLDFQGVLDGKIYPGYDVETEVSEPNKKLRLIVPFVTSGDLKGFDSETTYDVEEGYQTLPPVQPPINPPYESAINKRKAAGTRHEYDHSVETFPPPNPTELAMDPGRKLTLTFSGGAEKLVGDVREVEVHVTGDETGRYSIPFLLGWIKANLIVERPELLVEGDDVRPGILLLVDDTDSELLDKENYGLRDGNKVSFISTLHGG